MSEARLTLNIHEDWETKGERDVELASAIDLEAETTLTGLAWVGIVAIIVGVVLLLVGSLLFVVGYPDKWYGNAGYTFAQATSHIRTVMTLFGLGLIGFFSGASCFFYGRRTKGQGRTQRLLLEAT